MTTELADNNARFSKDLLFYAARGFIEALSPEQRDVFQTLFGGANADTSVKTSIEQANFERGEGNVVNPDAPVLSALQYALPRMSTAGWTVATEIERVWPSLSETTRKLIRSRINKAIEARRSGMAVDTAHWRRVAKLPVDEAEQKALSSF
jgi:hypothetical protein